MNDQSEPRAPAMVRFGTAHYVDLANLHADVMQAMNNELMVMTAERNRYRDTCQKLAAELAAAKKAMAEVPTDGESPAKEQEVDA